MWDLADLIDSEKRERERENESEIVLIKSTQWVTGYKSVYIDCYTNVAAD